MEDQPPVPPPPPYDPLGAAGSPAPPASPGPPGGLDSGLPVLPFEQPGVPFLEGLIATVKLFLTRPSEAFRRMPVTPQLTRPLIYGLLIGWVGVVIGTVWDVLFRGVYQNLIPNAAEGSHYQLSVAMQWMVAMIAPVWLPILLFVSAAILHLSLMVVGGATRGYTATFRVICYTYTPVLLYVVPVCGGLVGGIWSIVLEILGFSIVHRISVGKSVMAVLLPLLLCCACVALISLFFGAAMMAGLSKMR
jgi:hypothetical protein